MTFHNYALHLLCRATKGLGNRLETVTDSPGTPAVRLRPEILATAPYRQGKPAPAEAYKLSSNENPFPPIPAVVEAIAAMSVNRYPDAAATLLSERLAERFGVSRGEVHVGSGSVSILAQFIQAAAGPGDEVLYSWRSFEAYPGLVTVAGATSIRIPNLPDHRHDLAAMAAAVTDRTRVAIVCTPNNPTGSIVTAEEFAAFMAAVPGDLLVLLDEAYVEFVTDPAAVNGRDVLGRYPNLVVLRTFSKAYGLAGLRVGYAIGPERILDAARATAIPLSVTEPAQRAALAALDHEEELLERVAVLAARRDDVFEAVRAQGWPVPRSQANFLWFATGADTEAANDIFLAHGIVGRVLLPEGIRISIGEAESVEKLLAASAEVVEKLPGVLTGPTLD
ncbi:histidinol-phosphate transaminase [Leifsonia bigeumensis]|uniref:Histidinol-phosphate aminotransferase n=1 Tax=Leifsonella bigeumensis TaxID=433643 RepID=A0ABP7F1L9_9MICO